jgi:hypothetical protein
VLVLKAFARCDDDRLANQPVRKQRGFYFSQFDPVPCNLHLQIFSSQKFDGAIWQRAAHVSGFV